LQLLRKTSMDASIAAAPTIVDGILYLGDWQGKFRAVNTSTGEILWSQNLGIAPSPVNCSPGLGVSAQAAVSGDTVYAAGGDSAVYAMNRRTGEIQWRTPLADPAAGAYLWSSIVIYRNSLYVGIASLTDCPLVRGGLARIPLDDPAHPLIRYLVPEGHLGAGVWSTPAIDELNGIVYITTGNGAARDAKRGAFGSALLALDAGTLEIRSYFFMPATSEATDPDWGSSPLLFEAAGQPLVAANGKNGVLYVLRRPDLSLLWSSKIARDCNSPTLGCGSISTPAFNGSLLVTGSGQPEGDGSPAGMVYAIDPTVPRPVWQYAARSAVLAPVTLTPGLVWVSTLTGVVVLDAASGKELWADAGKGGSGALFSQPVVADGILYAAYLSGDIVAWGAPAETSVPYFTPSK
jgi:polyvinyl alcohol dehydrogenase (cytochrome)